MVTRFAWLCHAYCLMDNHYHLLIETPAGNLSPGMRQLNGVYTQRVNRRHARVGHVFQGQVLLGSAAFVEKLRPQLAGKAEFTEIPRAQRWAHRPGLKSLISPRVRQDKPARDAAMRRACLEYGYTMATVAREAGLHHSTVSKVIKGDR